MLVLNEHFPEVPPHAVLEPTWNRVFSAPWERRAPIHVKEGLCPLWGLRRCAKQVKHHHHRRLFLCDNMSVVLALEKGRAADRKLLFICRRWSAHVLAANIRARLRWIPSEGNPSDEDSRVWGSNYEGEKEQEFKFKFRGVQVRPKSFVAFQTERTVDSPTITFPSSQDVGSEMEKIRTGRPAL